jgi:preprotein translocase subunit YajC
VTTGGIIGKVVRVGEGELRIEVADGVQIRVVKGSISEVRGKGEPVKEKSKAEPPSKSSTSEGDESGKQPAA